MISRFRRHDRHSSHEHKPERPEHENFDSQQQSKGFGPSNSTWTGLSEFDLPLRHGHESKAKEKERSRDRRADPLGLTVLHEPESSPSADIIFVHGLGGTSRHTWSKNRDLYLFWPLEWLPYEPELSSARIMTFGYNSQFSSVSQRKESALNISDFAKDLLFSMKFATGEGERKLDLGSVPILFVAHSMGGLVVKKAYILGQHDEHYRELIQAISGIVFLSTPHRGSHLAEVLNRILSACVFAFSPKQYISELSLNSPSLQEINEQFRNLAPSLSIVSFFETLRTVIGPSQVMVCQKDSSILGYPGEISKPLDADHHDVCKYSSQQDPNYISVRSILKYLIGKHRSPNLPKVESNSVDELHEIASAFGRVDGPTDDLLFFSDRRMPSSCEWTKDDPDFNSFLLDESIEPRCLWCTGRPGSGKSVLASSIIQTVHEGDSNFAFYFFRFGDQVKNNLNTLLLSLAYQIAGVLPEYRRRLLRLFADGLNVPKSAPRLLWQKLFVSTFLKLTLARPLLIIIDGLDECDSSGLFLKFLEDFHAFSGPVRILVLSRSTQSLSTAFEKLSKKIQVRHHPLEQINHDLRRYVNEEMANMHGDEEFKDAIASELVRKADGNFLWATLVLTEILQCHTEDAVFEALDNVPEELEPLYERMDSTLAKSCRPSDRAMGKTILLWIACSRYQLNLLDLAEALKSEYANILDLRYTISRVCGEFVIVDGKGVVSLVHSSARDCLFQNPTLNYHIPRDSSHQFIFARCITALVDASPGIQKGHTKSQAFLLYASTSWPFHLEQAAERSDQESLLLLARFFENSAVLSWIYLLSVAGQLRVLVQSSKTMSSFLKKIDRLDEGRSPLTHRLREKELLLLWIRDLVRLVGKFGSHLNDQPKLIFKLVAPLCPQHSIMFRQFGTRNSAGISLSGLSNNSWDDCLARFAVHDAETPLQIKCANRYFAILVSDGTVLLYHASTCEDARRFHHGERVLAWCFNQIGDKLTTYGLTKTTVWVTATGQELCSSANVRRSKAVTIAFADGDETLVICCDDRVVRRLSLSMLDDGWRVLEKVLGEDTFEGKQCGSPRCASFNPSASQIAITYRAIPLAVWSLDEPGPVLIGRCQRLHEGRHVHGSGSDVQCITWNPMTGHVLGIYNDGCVFKWQPFENDYDESSVPVGKIECSPDGKFFVTSSRDGTLRIWDFDHFTPVYQLFYSAPVISFAIDPNDTRIYDIRESFCSVWEPNALVRMWETEDKSSETMSTRESTQISQISEAILESLQPITALAVDFESSSYAVGNNDGLVTHFTKDGKVASELIQTFMTVEHICWSDDGRYIAASGLGRRIILKEVDQARPSQMSKPIMTAKEEDPIRQILLSPTGIFLLVATDRFLNIWSTHQKQILSTRPQITLHRWLNCPSDGNKVIGIGHAGVQIIDWQEPASTRLLTLQQVPVDSTTNQRPYARRFKRPSELYPMSPNETDEVIEKTFLTVDDTLLLTVISRSTPQGRRENQYTLINTANMYSSPSTKVTAMALPPELQSNLVIPLGFLAADPSLEFRRRPTLQSTISSTSENVSSRPAEHVLAFLDHSFWVCTYVLSETRLGRVKRHFFLPRDWQNWDWLELAVMRPDGTLLCPRNGEVALVEKGLREEWLE